LVIASSIIDDAITGKVIFVFSRIFLAVSSAIAREINILIVAGVGCLCPYLLSMIKPFLIAKSDLHAILHGVKKNYLM